MAHVLVTGAFGQIGTELTRALRERYGRGEVIATGHRLPSAPPPEEPTEPLDVTDERAVARAIQRHGVEQIYHLAAQLSAVGEHHPRDAWTVNMTGLVNVLEGARHAGVRRVFWPSSIAVFGPDAPADRTPQDAALHPTTIYGVAKVAGELLCDYYNRRYGLSIRGLRYPGVISSETLPGGGTTDYAVEMFHAALGQGHYTCFVRADTVLPMIYMPDCLKAATALMEADESRLVHHNGFNIHAMSFSARALADEIAGHVPGFSVEYVPDARQDIADSWPHSLDDSSARHEWGWTPDFGLPDMTRDMLARLRRRAADTRSTP